MLWIISYNINKLLFKYSYITSLLQKGPYMGNTAIFLYHSSMNFRHFYFLTWIHISYWMVGMWYYCIWRVWLSPIITTKLLFFITIKFAFCINSLIILNLNLNFWTWTWNLSLNLNQNLKLFLTPSMKKNLRDIFEF